MARTFNLAQCGVQPTNFRIDYEKELNPQQLEAVKEFSGPMLCIAGAGSGKTRTLIYRVARMIESGVNPGSILLLTFTRKAARNMLDRVVALVGADGKLVAGGTYHSFASGMLRKYGHYIGIPPRFSILDESDAGDIINLLRSEMGLNKKETRFPTKATLGQIFSKAHNLEMQIPEVINAIFSHFAEHTQAIVELYKAFVAYKLKNALLDYDDLLIYLLRLISESPEARRRITTTFRYIMADEYQDTNAIQARITLLLGGETRNIMVVGDDAQSIYSFRGARVKNIIEFPEAFENCKIVRLERNYRSSASILAAANNLMEKACEGFKKTLFTERPAGDLPARVKCEDEQEQALFIAARILELREQGIKLQNMAVLFRSSFHAYQLELELKRRNIPYVKWGGFKFLEAGHLKDVIAHLRVMQNPFDQVSWLRILLLIEGIGTQSATAIFEHLKKQVDPLAPTDLKFRPRAADGLKKMFQMLNSGVKLGQVPPVRLLEVVSDYYFPLLKARYDDYPKRFKDIDQLSLIAGKFENLADFLADLALEPPKDSVDGALASETDDDEALVLSTIHSAKGLEWHSVFIISTLEGRFPSFNALKTPADTEEERRLLYVAMTRAAENLAISYPSQLWDPATGTILARPSRFLEELRENLLENWQITR
ncbi:MAG TPA: ATP-dependent helicase [Candidatus Rifleibacterium sp.]|nr:ATP-dependent helicase [Candidatus Rifleibacterium sp.]HPT46324.1 ATP-dependent helicase [Candidatus Rifleibacterium sp.]